ncbi:MULTISPECIES: ABC transporter ATP-binding protein [unclassified Rhodococcus (in: high G+C Gram-positive bacteria)]|uniref:ABC transporter ATP-binding protein n=1 Tax=unclassified Rhodococcus (in: high G+C Gram-positive bacteria) TaxID=192944 RepID=UPI00163B4024|nr:MULTISPECIES: ABC transporter ATP-binding protein [unclassified Rhodococcus (in: high G+C Gram-positive bacteria)]MBC2643815.1 ATP-binding cassette domain-containing protein [Rhodococcus sp. 3A]MBC2891444.1 ATP-binding cassette domain-containing protein [Rhodococcus sp. 4CII]
MTSDIVVTDRLTKRYGEHTAVDAVSLTVRAGEVYGFLGPNGAGKTTTLRMLTGLVRPSSGTATLFGHAPGNHAVAARTGVLIEGPGFFPYLSGRDNLRVLSRYRRLPDDAVESALQRVGLRDRGQDRFRTYSLGMKQRLGVAAALLGEPDLLLLDEPTNGLDPAGMAEMRELIVELADSGHSVMLSSHMLSEVQEICDRVGVIARGELIAESTVAELRGGTSLLVRADPQERAATVLAELLGRDVVDTAGDALALAVSPDLAPKVARVLVDAGIDVHELSRRERSLEDVFFAMTSDGGHGDRTASNDSRKVS